MSVPALQLFGIDAAAYDHATAATRRPFKDHVVIPPGLPDDHEGQPGGRTISSRVKEQTHVLVALGSPDVQGVWPIVRHRPDHTLGYLIQTGVDHFQSGWIDAKMPSDLGPAEF